MKNGCNFTCWVMKYNNRRIYGKTYQKDSLKSSDGMKVPLIWNHKHNDINAVLGHAILEHREEGIYAYCTLVNNHPYRKYVVELIQNRGRVSLSPFITNIEYEKENIIKGNIREVSLVHLRIDQDESYYPIIKLDDMID